MEYRRLGRTGLQVPLISLGTGGPSSFGQARGAAFEEQYALVHAALAMGINFFDTAAGYRQSEELLGRTLADVPRDSYILASKCSLTKTFQGEDYYEFGEIISQCDRSLQRLGVDVIDVYQLHGVHVDRYDFVVERYYPALEKLKEQGKIRFTGITEAFSSDPAHEMLKRAVASDLFDTIMVKYGILNQTADHALFPLCLEHDVGVLNMATVRVALATQEALTKIVGQWVSKGLIKAGELPEEDPLGWLVDENTENVISASYKFGAAPAAVSTVLTGTSDLRHLRENVDAVLGPPLAASKTRRLVDVLGQIADGSV